jgi:Ethanolamine utilization protein EutJ (predicted chaperonin)
MNPDLAILLEDTERIMAGADGWQPDPALRAASGSYRGTLHVGVDLGTAYTVLVVLDESFKPIGGEYRQAEIV